MRSAAALLFLSRLTTLACSTGPDELEGTSLRLDWPTGDSWHVAARSRKAANMGEELPVDLETGLVKGGSPDAVLGELWTEDIIWTYQVVETGLRPSEDDQLYPYALHRGEVKPLAVVKARVDSILNDDPAVLEADPVVYLVFREDTDRLAAVISFENVAGERVERAWSSTRLGRSWSVLSQSALAGAPPTWRPRPPAGRTASVSWRTGTWSRPSG